VIHCSCPADGRNFGDINPKSPDAIDRLVRRAKNAQPEWAKTTFSQRRKVLKTLLKYILDHQDEIITIACLDSGKTKVDAVLGEILVTTEKIKWTIDHGEKALKSERRPTNLLMTYKANEVRWEAIGVVAACVSWNYPFHNFMGPIISAIFAGNSIVVKPSEQTAWSSNWFLDIAKGAVAQCGHSHNIIQSAPCYPNSAERLTSHPDIAHITFIGSRTVAHKVCTSAAKSLTPVCVELGGKDPAILLDDIKTKDLRPVSDILMRGVFQSAGQNCIGIERVISCPKVYDSIISLVEPKIRALRVGSALFPGQWVNSNEEDEAADTGNAGHDNGTILNGYADHPDKETDVQSNESGPICYPEVDMGAMISSRSFPHLEELIEDAVKHGARLLVGGKAYDHPDFPRGNYFQPTLLVDVRPDMRIAQEELFAPIFLLMPASSTENAIEIANSTIYGLGASVFGTSKTELEKVVSGVKSGMVAVNDFAAYYAVQLPFGGVKGSGYGRFAGEEGLRSLCNTKAVCWDRWPSLINTRIPSVLTYPIKTMGGAWNFAMGLVELAYGETWKRRVGGMKRIVKNA
jgi:acyl-CoA reductase-like NAD-dependent aldehyde dehydrogenase